MKYYANGNIKTKSDINSTVDFTYGSSAGPYALTGVSSSTGVIPSIIQKAHYTSFEKADTIKESPYEALLYYNSDRQRCKMVVNQSGTTILTRWYAGSRYMKETAAGITKEYTYIGGDAYNAPVAAVTQSGTTTYYYLLRDYLGNITHQVNTSNTVVAEYNFDAWGRRRSADDWSYTMDANDLALFADRGFTGHEYLEDFKLYNMNGRLYDPVVGRFLSPDPYVQDPSFTQSLNRYSYCLNNPLKFNDPTGEKWNWNWLNPLYHFENFMQWVNDKTPQLRQNMAKAGIPPFGVGTSVNFAGNVNYNASIYGQQVFNTANINRSGPSVQATYKELVQVRQDYGRAWRGEDSSPDLGAGTLIGAIGFGSDLASMSNSTFRLMSGLNGSFSPKIYSSGWNGGSPARITTYGLSKIGTRVSTASGAISTYMAYNDIIKGKDQPITWVDAGVGTVGLGASISTYFTGVEIPVVGEFVAVYGALRLSWDVGFYMGANYGPSKWYGTDNTKWFK